MKVYIVYSDGPDSFRNLKVFKSENSAEDFTQKCYRHQKIRPILRSKSLLTDDEWRNQCIEHDNWVRNHPAGENFDYHYDIDEIEIEEEEEEV